jgi:hypothetical protein
MYSVSPRGYSDNRSVKETVTLFNLMTSSNPVPAVTVYIVSADVVFSVASASSAAVFFL